MRKLTFYTSIQEKEEMDLARRILLTPQERLQEMRKMIDLAYKLAGKDMSKLPEKHVLKFHT